MTATRLPVAHMKCRRARCGHEYQVKAAAFHDGRAYFGSAYDFCPKCDGAPKEVKRTGMPRPKPKTIIHVNQHVIRANLKTGARDPVLTVKRGKTNTYAHEVDIQGPCRLIYSPDRPLSCGARVWVEVAGDVEVVTR